MSSFKMTTEFLRKLIESGIEDFEPIETEPIEKEILCDEIKIKFGVNSSSVILLNKDFPIAKLHIDSNCEPGSSLSIKDLKLLWTIKIE